MMFNPNYAKMFRSRPARFILPMKPDLDNANNENLIKLDKTDAQAHYLQNGNILVEPEKLSDIGCETPRIHYENYLGM